ncbi:putative DNA modification/repair radical SAM protein [Rubellimicrobium thermophilum DSM 16684]|uniref:Putative DNA modification/repair radical SAM protein n=1 Tax=Rubellimicrobium thermophilum DSM 16684 TaxID=1123069 RepID=S9R3Y3_9RHOB|nr:putative DNA modification/repair radical SAM protein [Rubellimicrobium thermophilum]EPX86703.1 putative DNA modification/repair radical SAM protein [Rubellimicrobium thermophilum DSM 16684]
MARTLHQKLQILAEAARHDASCASSGGQGRDARKGEPGHTTGSGICHAFTPDGRCISLLKVLMTNFCIFDCAYCPSRLSADTPRARLAPEEVVQLTIEFYRRNMIEGLFLSSGIIRSPDDTMQDMIRILRILREREGFRGYIHLKVIPGASAGLIEEAGLLADRLSVNVELPTEAGLARLAPRKDAQDIRRQMATIRLRTEAAQERSPTGRRPPPFAPAGQSTQVIVGADGAADAEILRMSEQLYAGYRLRRVYYSAYVPVPGASDRLPPRPPPLLREHRLYQADWLLRHYGFTAEEVLPAGDLDPDLDPKTAWALRHRHLFPVDVRRAGREMLLRVPGFGTRTVDRILSARRHRALRWEDLRHMGAVLGRAAPFVEAEDWHPRGLLEAEGLRDRLAPPPQQLSLF